MKNDLTCAVVRDLLPMYIDGLTSQETNEALERHLSACPDCAALLTDLREPRRETAAPDREVDYLKTVRRRGFRRVVLAVLCTLTLFLAGFALKIFVLGSPVQSQSLYWDINENTAAQTLSLSVGTADSAAAFRSWNVNISDGHAFISARRVLVSPLFQRSSEQFELPTEGLSSIYLAGELIWQEGVEIKPSTHWLYETQTPYVGDPSALNRITDQLPAPGLLGSYTTELKTGHRPYRWTFCFQNAGGHGPSEEDLMRRRAVVYLALVENLDEVGWACGDAPFTAQVLTLEEAALFLREQTELYNKSHGTDWEAPSSVKDCTASILDFQILLNVLSLS